MVSFEKSCLFYVTRKTAIVCRVESTSFSSHCAVLRPRPSPRLVLGGGGRMSSSLSDDTGSLGFRDGFATVGRGVVVSWQCSMVKGRIS